MIGDYMEARLASTWANSYGNLWTAIKVNDDKPSDVECMLGNEKYRDGTLLK